MPYALVRLPCPEHTPKHTTNVPTSKHAVAATVIHTALPKLDEIVMPSDEAAEAYWLIFWRMMMLMARSKGSARAEAMKAKKQRSELQRYPRRSEHAAMTNARNAMPDH